MEILRQVAKERLVIMVTHNPDLANQYATRIIRLLDGLIVSDSATEQLKPADRDHAPAAGKKKTFMTGSRR